MPANDPHQPPQRRSDDASNAHDDELELEPIDPEILAREKSRADTKTTEALSRADVDEMLRDEEEEGLEFDSRFLSEFRFTTRHLLVATALLALAMTLFNLLGECNGLFVGLAFALAAGWYWTLRLERQRDARRQARRDAILAGEAPPSEAQDHDQPVLPQGWRERFAIDLAFSTRELMIAISVAAVVLAALHLLGPANMALLLGIVALVGLATNALDFDALLQVVLAWWMLLVLYLGVSLLAIAW